MANWGNYFKLLLIITMVIQPITFSYAMANVAHGHHAPSLAHSDNGDYAMNKNMADAHYQNIHQESDSDVDNCCHTTTCNPASMVNTGNMPHVPKSQCIVSIAPAQKSIDLPPEIKPPRSHLR